MYTQALFYICLFYALLVTRLAYVHIFLICTLSIYICWNWILLLLFLYEYQWGNNTVFTGMQDNSNLRQPPQNNMPAKGKCIYSRNKMYAKKKYFTLNLMHKACQILSTFTNQCHCHHLHMQCLHLHCHSTSYQHQSISLHWIYSTS